MRRHGEKVRAVEMKVLMRLGHTRRCGEQTRVSAVLSRRVDPI